MDILTLFFEIDEFCQQFEPAWKQRLVADGKTHRNRERTLSLSEIMTIIVLFHSTGYRTFKQFYCELVSVHLTREFPDLISYSRFVQLQGDALLPLAAYLQTRAGKCTGISFIDATKIVVCQNLRIPNHKQFADIAARGKTSTGWFYGFKLHLTVNDCGELLSWFVTPGNVDDRKPVTKLAKGLSGKLFGDKGYLSNPLKLILGEQDLELVTNVRKNMKPVRMSAEDKILLRKRSIIETVIDQLKNISQIEHSRHRSLWNFLVNLVGGLIAYSWREKKPTINYFVKELTVLG